MRLERLSEVRAVEAAVTEFQRGEPHRVQGAQPGDAPPPGPRRPAVPSTHAVGPRLAPRRPRAPQVWRRLALRAVSAWAHYSRIQPGTGCYGALRGGRRAGNHSGEPAAAPGSERGAERMRPPPPRLLGSLALQQPRAPSHSSLGRPAGVRAARTC